MATINAQEDTNGIADVISSFELHIAELFNHFLRLSFLQTAF
jgi:hypothetical protein